MEKKELSRRYNSFRTFFGNWNICKYLSGKFNLAKSALIVRNLGFTLVELIVVIAILGILFAITIVVLDPAKQIGKLNDAKRETDIKQITQALDTFYNDNNCYPVNNLDNPPTGLDLLENAPVYINKVPVDPQTKEPYLYVVDPADCPQWNVIFAKLNYSSNTKVDCPLASDCLPVNYTDSGYNYCAVSGNIDCDFLSNYELPLLTGPTGAPLPGDVTDTPTLSPGQSPTDTPTLGFSCPAKYYACTQLGVNGCNELSGPDLCSLNGGTYQCFCDSQCSDTCH